MLDFTTFTMFSMFLILSLIVFYVKFEIGSGYIAIVLILVKAFVIVISRI